VSGGKDSQACALAVAHYLDTIGHQGPRILVHSHLGRVEWRDSEPTCERLAAALGWELMVVRRKAGDMLDRWEARWASSVKRYAELSCVKLILPWSTPVLRFCTSELKVDQISAALKKRFVDLPIINASGIRREESPTRSRMPVSAPMAKLARKGLPGFTWNPIIEWSVEHVWQSIRDSGLTPHEAYGRYGISRVSCAFCIMSSEADLRAATGCRDNDDLYRAMVDLEARSTFAFQGARWLADVAPDLLSSDLRLRIACAKSAAVARVSVEAEIPAHLLYTAGWPNALPTREEAELIASARRRVADLVGIEVQCRTAGAVRDRYAELMTSRSLETA
jgi:3'-phosphoadenosine 5'-phosphosulfate sulfotransferase (PAPS reductase)/FAD synthetase